MWASTKQTVVALSSTEAEYIAATSAVREALWLKKMMNDMQLNIKDPIPIHEDNLGCIQIAKNPETKRSKHIDVKFHFIRHCIQENDIKLVPTSTNEQVADCLTKPLPRMSFEKFRKKLSLH